MAASRSLAVIVKVTGSLTGTRAGEAQTSSFMGWFVSPPLLTELDDAPEHASLLPELPPLPPPSDGGEGSIWPGGPGSGSGSGVPGCSSSESMTAGTGTTPPSSVSNRKAGTRYWVVAPNDGWRPSVTPVIV